MNNTGLQQHNPFEALKYSEYRNLMLGRFFYIMGLRMMGTLVGWWVYDLTNAPIAIGIIGLSEVIPAVSLALYAGHIIDISEKRKLLLRGAVMYICCALALLFLSTPFIKASCSNYQIAGFIFIVIFCTGIIRAFTGPIFSTIIGIIVPRNVLQNATTWNQGSWLSASVAGHVIGGILIAGIGICYTLTVISILVFAGTCFMFQLKPKPVLQVTNEKKTWESVKEGLLFVFNTKEVLGALTLDLFAVFFGGAVTMIPVYAKDILKVGAEGFGWLNGASDIGSIIITLSLTFFPLRKKQGKVLLYAVAGFGICIITFALSSSFLISFAALLLSGILDGISMVVRGTILQLNTPSHMRGRVMSVNSMFINSSNELGQFESGVAAKLMGVVSSVVFGGTMTILVVIGTWIKAPKLRKMEY